MVKKERKISIPNFDKSAFLQPVGMLPTSNEITKTVAKVTGKVTEKTTEKAVKAATIPAPIVAPVPASIVAEPRQKGRPLKEASKERLPFNTMMNINLSNTIKIMAIKRRVSSADLIEIAITRYLQSEGELE
jgi:hypothetical protein